ncbi:MAG: Fic family protein [Planctomycetota bacterium]|nr:Fic family protein [Planctomycetota bacterium]
MQALSPELDEHYKRALRDFENVSADSRAIISAKDVLNAHYLLVDFFMREGDPIAMPGPRSPDLLFSAVARQTTSFNGRLKWNDPLERCASLFFGLVKNHAFHDGNKRTALLVALYNLSLLNRTTVAKQREFEILAVRTAGSELAQYNKYDSFARLENPEVRFLADFFRQKTRKTDTRIHVITFNDLNRILRKYNFGLENASGNYIDVVRFVEEKYGFFLKPKLRTVSKKLTQIGFPRWSAQVHERALRSVLAATGLTRQNGFDSQVIFQEAEPLNALIDSYREPLKKLSHK